MWTYRGVNVYPVSSNASGIRWYARLDNSETLRADTKQGMRQLIKGKGANIKRTIALQRYADFLNQTAFTPKHITAKSDTTCITKGITPCMLIKGKYLPVVKNQFSPRGTVLWYRGKWYTLGELKSFQR